MKEHHLNKQTRSRTQNGISKEKLAGKKIVNSWQILQTVVWNAEGLNGTLQLVPYDFFHKYDIVCLTETFLMKDWYTQGFYCINNLATQYNIGRPKGGITCLIKPNLSPFKMEYKSRHILMVRTRLCTIICAYFQPELTAEDIIEELDEAMSKTSKSDQILLAGDLNCRIDIPSKKTNLVIEHLEEEGCHMINTSSENTYVGPNGTSTINLVFINDGLKEISQSVLSNV